MIEVYLHEVGRHLWPVSLLDPRTESIRMMKASHTSLFEDQKIGGIQHPSSGSHSPPHTKGSLLSLPGARYYPVHTLRAESNDQGSRLTIFGLFRPLIKRMRDLPNEPHE